MATEHNETNGADVTIKSYLTGFTLALVLTVIPFGMVISHHNLPRSLVLSGIGVTAIAQVFVHLYYFLHLNAASGQRRNLPALLFTVLVLVIIAGGTIWVMLNLHQQMAPM